MVAMTDGMINPLARKACVFVRTPHPRNIRRIPKGHQPWRRQRSRISLRRKGSSSLRRNGLICSVFAFENRWIIKALALARYVGNMRNAAGNTPLMRARMIALSPGLFRIWLMHKHYRQIGLPPRFIQSRPLGRVRVWKFFLFAILEKEARPKSLHS